MARLAARSEVFTAAQLRELGLSADDISYRVRTARLHRQFRGVYSLAPKVSVHSLIRAATLSTNGVVGFFAAVHLYGLTPTFVGPVDVVSRRRMRPREGIRPHYRPSLDAIREPHGIPATTPAETLLDLAGTNITDRHYTRLVNEAQVQGLVTEEELAAAAERARGKPTKRLIQRITDGPTPTRSSLEDDFAAFTRRHQLPDTLFNARIHGVEVDAYIPSWNLVIELDGDKYHATRISRHRDAGKQAMLEASGLRHLRLTGEQLADEPQTLRRLRSSATSSRP